jgi:hypothetical protein
LERGNAEHATGCQTRGLTLREAGRLGGLSTLTRHGLDHYRKAGRKGQAKLNARFGKAQRALWGSLGGRPKKPRSAGMGEKG